MQNGIDIDGFILLMYTASFMMNLHEHIEMCKISWICNKCIEYGKWHNNRVVYRVNTNVTKSDESFLRQDENHHLGISSLLRLEIGIVSFIWKIVFLSHLLDDVEKYDPLDLFSAFSSENYFSQIKILFIIIC